MAMARAPLLPAALLLATVALLSTEANAQATTWEFTTIADSAAELASFSIPSINNAGQIAFIANFDDVPLGQAVYRREANGVLTPIAVTGEAIASFSGDPSLNASGLVTFTAAMRDGSVSVLCGNGGALITIANTFTHALTSIDNKPFISDTGGVVIVRAVRGADGARVILKGTGGPPATLLASTGTYDPVDVAGINSSGVVAFEAETLGGTVKGVYRTTDGIAVTPIAITSAGGFTAVEALDINNNGTVVFFAETATGVGSVSVQTADSPSRAFAETPSPFISFGPAAVAETGAVAFRGTLELGLNGIFAGGTGLYEKAIALGDPLLGSGVNALDTGPEAVTNAGRFVFRASRINSTTGIYLATPSASDGGGGGGGAFDLVSVTLLLLANRLRGRLRRRPYRGPAPGGRFGV